MRVYAATFTGAFLTALIYSTKPDADRTVTLVRSGDTAIVVDTARRDSGAAATGSVPLTSAAIASDLDALRALAPAIPVAGVTANDLVDTFDAPRGTSRRHNALDIMAPRNTPVVAATSGKIVRLHSSVAGGLTIYATDSAERFIMLYGHLDGYRPGLGPGTAVKRGELIGFVGSSGNVGRASPHLHFQIMRADTGRTWWRGTPINPYPVYRPSG